jgi:hypothetical protein
MRLLADENFNGDILRGLQRRVPAIVCLGFMTWSFASLTTLRFWNGLRQRGAWF